MSIGRGRTSLYHYGELDFRLRRAWDGQIVQQRHLRCNLSLQPGRGLCTGWQLFGLSMLVWGAFCASLVPLVQNIDRADRLGHQGY